MISVNEKRSSTEQAVEYILGGRHGAVFRIADQYGFSYIYNDYPAIPDDVSDSHRHSVIAAREVVSKDREALFNLSGNELLKIKGLEEDKARFFSSPLNDASTVYWARMSYWSIEEGVSLLLGKNPRKVSWKIMRERLDEASVKGSPFVKLYRHILDLANQAVRSGVIGKSLHPSSFLVWANANGLDIPENLQAAVYRQLISLLEDDESMSVANDAPVDPVIRTMIEEWCALVSRAG